MVRGGMEIVSIYVSVYQKITSGLVLEEQHPQCYQLNLHLLSKQDGC